MTGRASFVSTKEAFVMEGSWTCWRKKEPKAFEGNHGKKVLFQSKGTQSIEVMKETGGYIYEKIFYIGIRYGRTSR